MKRFSQVIVVVFFSFLSLTINAQNRNASGSLFIIGGGNRSDSLIAQLVKTANLRTNDYVVVLPMASAEPEAGFTVISQQLAKFTSAAIRNFDFAKKPSINERWIDSLSGARLIYILGGDQSRFMKAVLNTPIYNAIHRAYNQGATIAGTSAGAAVMSKYMITGRQLKDSVYKETFDKLWSDNIEFTDGLGLLPEIIIDQHFLKRSRYSRLLSALAEKPNYVCIGIDEGTAIIVRGEKATVAGESQVLRFANPKGTAKTTNGHLKFEKIDLGVFTAGDVISLKK
ncbi:MAG: cyanophycinase [Chitinophagaceae bacterium]|nr:MAG: cyanophycinase [Chitinophagaceae bacterium]